MILFYIIVRVRLVLDFSLMKEQLVYSLPFGFAVALQLFSNYFDKFVCIRMLTPTDYAIYGIAFLSIPGVSQIYDSLCQVNIVNMSNSFRCGRIEEILPQYGNFVIKTFSFSVPVIFVVSLYAEEIMNFLYTSSYVAAAPYFRLYSLTFLASMFGAGTILRSMGKTNMSLYAFLITCILGLPSTYFLVTSFGTSGAIWGAFINIMLPRFIQMGFEIYVTRSGLLHFLPWRKIFEIFIVSIVLHIPLFVLKLVVCQHIVVCIILGAVYVLLVYMVLLKKNLFIVDKEKINLMLKKTKLWIS